MQNFTSIPNKSVFIIPSMINDKELAKMTKSRLTIAYIYGFIRNMFNVSLNNPNAYYSKHYHNIYCVEQIPTLMERSGLGRNSIVNAFKALNRCNYIHTVYNPHRHVNFIFLPKLTNKLIKSNKLGVSLESKLSQFGKQTNVSLESKLRCSNQNSNNQNVTTYNSKTTKKSKNRMINWIHNYDYPGKVNELLKECCPNLKQACAIASDISNIKVSVNKHAGIYSKRNLLFSNKTNDYIQNGGLFHSLNRAFNSNHDIDSVISHDYSKFVHDYKQTTLNNAHNNYGHVVIKQKLPKWARSNYHEKLHPTSKKMQRKIRKQLKELNSTHKINN